MLSHYTKQHEPDLISLSGYRIVPKSIGPFYLFFSWPALATVEWSNKLTLEKIKRHKVGFCEVAEHGMSIVIRDKG